MLSAQVRLCRDLSVQLANMLYVKRRMEEAAAGDAIIRVSPHHLRHHATVRPSQPNSVLGR